MPQNISLIDPKAPPKDCVLLFTSDNWYGEKTHRLYIIPGFLVIHVSEVKNVPVDQLVLPLEALPWLVDQIENKFWREPWEGGLPRDVLHVQEAIAGEIIRLGRSNNAGAEILPGFTLRNLSRLNRFAEGEELNGFNCQNDVIPDIVLKEGGLFNLLKSIAERYLKGEFGPTRKK